MIDLSSHCQVFVNKVFSFRFYIRCTPASLNPSARSTYSQACRCACPSIRLKKGAAVGKLGGRKHVKLTRLRPEGEPSSTVLTPPPRSSKPTPLCYKHSWVRRGRQPRTSACSGTIEAWAGKRKRGGEPGELSRGRVRVRSSASLVEPYIQTSLFRSWVTRLPACSCSGSQKRGNKLHKEARTLRWKRMCLHVRCGLCLG